MAVDFAAADEIASCKMAFPVVSALWAVGSDDEDTAATAEPKSVAAAEWYKGGYNGGVLAFNMLLLLLFIVDDVEKIPVDELKW